MSVNLSDDLVRADEIPASRRFRLSDDQLRRAIEAGIIKPGDGPGDRVTLEQYHQLGEADILTDRDRVELFGGWLVTRMTMYPPHRISTRSTRVALERVVPPGWYVDQNAAVTMPVSGSEPEPDVQVVRGDSKDFSDRHPGPQDIALLVEVSDSSLSEDRGFQKRLYATDRVPIYWIVNLRNMRVEVYTEPSGPTGTPDYGKRADYTMDEAVPLVIDGVEIARILVSELLP